MYIMPLIKKHIQNYVFLYRYVCSVMILGLYCIVKVLSTTLVREYNTIFLWGLWYLVIRGCLSEKVNKNHRNIPSRYFYFW